LWQDFVSDFPAGFVILDAALVPSNDDAFDQFWAMQIDGAVVTNPADTPLSFATNAVRTTLTAPSVMLAGLEVAQQDTTFLNLPVLRVILSLTNATGAPVNVTARATGDFGSDSETKIEATSSGDATADTDDRWTATSDDGDSDKDPVLVTVFGGPGLPGVSPSLVTVVDGDGGFVVEFPMAVPANSTRHLLFFTRMSPDVASGTAGAAVFDDNAALAEAGLLGGLSAEQLGEIGNWDLP
jgi:hypothetical protein